MAEGIDLDGLVAIAEFRAALRSFLRRSEVAAQRSGLTPQRHLLLLMIKGAPDRSERETVTNLANRLQLGQSTVTELVARAEEAGLVERQPAQHDRRVVFVRVTEEGERRLQQCVTSLESERERLLAAIAEAARYGRAS